jgi:hypothetical protein
MVDMGSSSGRDSPSTHCTTTFFRSHCTRTPSCTPCTWTLSSALIALRRSSAYRADRAQLKLSRREEQLDVLAAILAAKEEEALEEGDDLRDDVGAAARKCVSCLMWICCGPAVRLPWPGCAPCCRHAVTHSVPVLLGAVTKGLGLGPAPTRIQHPAASLAPAPPQARGRQAARGRHGQAFGRGRHHLHGIFHQGAGPGRTAGAGRAGGAGAGLAGLAAQVQEATGQAGQAAEGIDTGAAAGKVQYRDSCGRSICAWAGALGWCKRTARGTPSWEDGSAACLGHHGYRRTWSFQLQAGQGLPSWTLRHGELIQRVE